MASLKGAAVSGGYTAPTAMIPGGIVGAAPNPYNAVVLTASPPSTGAFLYSEPVSVGATGEFGGLSAFTVEFWLQIKGIPGSASRFLVNGPEVSAAPHLQWAFQLTTAGKIFLYFYKVGDIQISVTSNAVLVPATNFAAGSGPWYHIAGSWDGGNLRVYINGAVDNSTGGSGTVMAWDSSPSSLMIIGDPANETGCDIAVDGLATYRRYVEVNRIAAHYQAGRSRGFAAKLPGARMIDVLDASQSVHAPRSLMAGSRTVTESYMTAQAPLDELNKARSADNVDAMLFVSKSGTVTFLDASHRSSSPWNTVQVVFGDAGGTELSYVDFGFEYSETFIINEWNASREQGRKSGTDIGAVQTASDATSIANYFRRPQDLSSLPVTLDADSGAIATAMLAKYKDPMYRGFTLTVNTSDPNVALNCLQRELGDRVEVKRTPPGGGARIDQVLFIQKIEVSGDASSPLWTIRFGLSPL